MSGTHLLEDLLGQKSKISILRLLVQEPELTGREIARRTGLSPRAAQQSLQALHAKGVLHRKSAGASYLFSLNTERYVVTRLLHPLFHREMGMFDVVMGELKKSLPRKGILSLVLFGSAARAESGPGSDLDVMILVDNAMDTDTLADKVRERSKEFSKKFGMPISPYVIRLRDLLSRFDRKDKLIRNIVKEGHVFWGNSLGEVLAFESKKVSH